MRLAKAIGSVAVLIGVLFIAACADEWMVWRQQRCVRRAMGKRRGGA